MIGLGWAIAAICTSSACSAALEAGAKQAGVWSTVDAMGVYAEGEVRRRTPVVVFQAAAVEEQIRRVALGDEFKLEWKPQVLGITGIVIGTGLRSVSLGVTFGF